MHELKHPADSLDYLQGVLFPPYITLAHLFHAPDEWELNPRTLTQFQIQYVVAGAAEYRIEDRVYLTVPGDLIVHCPEERHAVKTIKHEDNSNYVCISLVFHFGSTDFPFQQLLSKGNYIGNFKDQTPEKLLSQLVSHYPQNDLRNQLLCQGLLLQILALLAAWDKERTPVTPIQQKIKAKLVLVKNYLHRSFAEPVRHEQLEQISGLSRNYLIVQFKQTYQVTPFEYLTWLRIEKAKELVIQTNLSISEIACRVGYADVHAFGRMFKQKTGSSLSQFCSSLVR